MMKRCQHPVPGRPCRINALLLGVMLFAALSACLLHNAGSFGHADLVTLPVSTACTEPLPPLRQYRLERNETELRNMAALEALIQNDTIDSDLRRDAAAALAALVDARQKQLAVEGALLESGFGNCTAVLTGEQLTIVTDQPALTAADNAMLLELAQVHADIAPTGLRVICTAP